MGIKKTTPGYRVPMEWEKDATLHNVTNALFEARMNHDGYVCPYCGHRHFVDADDSDLVTLHGDLTAYTRECESCGKKFQVQEFVTRQFESTRLEEDE
jgi:DNA-directed RNA polymerase subunit RPC12/RpoP